jgi:hypothetical protein
MGNLIDHEIDQSAPHTKFCWECGRKLAGNHFRNVIRNGQEVTVHKECADPEFAEKKRYWLEVAAETGGE